MDACGFDVKMDRFQTIPNSTDTQIDGLSWDLPVRTRYPIVSLLFCHQSHNDDDDEEESISFSFHEQEHIHKEAVVNIPDPLVLIR